MSQDKKLKTDMSQDEKITIVDKWERVREFLKKNAGSLEPLSDFATTIFTFSYDRAYRNPYKQMFVHHVTPLQREERCDQIISFETREKSVLISVYSRVDDKDVVSEQTLVLNEDKSGKWSSGRLSRIGQRDVSFEIGQDEIIKPKTVKFSAPEATKPKSDGGKV